MAKQRLEKALVKSGALAVVYRRLSYGILARAGMYGDSFVDPQISLYGRHEPGER
jgi:hypothetical protein